MVPLSLMIIFVMLGSVVFLSENGVVIDDFALDFKCRLNE